MDDALKYELIRSGVPALVVPLVQSAVKNHFVMKRYDRQEEIELKKAERRARALHALHGGQSPRTRGIRPVEDFHMESPGDVYDRLSEIQHETDCQFCLSVAESLLDAPPDEARQGYAELRSYLDEVERIEERGADQAEVEQVVGDLVDRMEVVPKHFAGVA